jgi:uncharacterized tellurite resistance protein B-like protein
MKNDDIVRSVMCMLAADGSINKLEKQFLQSLCMQLGVSKEAVTAAFEEVKQGKGHIYLPDTEAERKQLFGWLVQAAVADGKIAPQERKMLDAVAAKIGIAASVVERYIAQSLKQDTSEPAPKEVSKPSAIMICPKCGVEQKEALRCSQCGIFVKNYLKQQNKTEERQQKPDQTGYTSKRAKIILYTPSGTITLYSISMGVLFGIVTAAGAGWLYQLLVGWNSLIYLNFLATFIYGAVIGLAVGLGLQFGKCRNVILGVVLAFFMAVIGDMLAFRFVYPGMEAIRTQVTNGWVISRFGFPVGIPLNGPAVYLVWAAEFILICITAMAAATIGPAEPFCERCQQWTKKQHLGKIPNIDEGYLLKALRKGDLQPFLDFPPKASWKTVSYDLYSCPRCRQGRYLRVMLEWEEEGKEQKEALLEYAIVTNEQIAELRSTLREFEGRGRISE